MPMKRKKNHAATKHKRKRTYKRNKQTKKPDEQTDSRMTELTMKRRRGHPQT